MKRLLLLWGALVATVAAGQVTPPVDEQVISQARARIEAERQQKTAAFAEEDNACLSRFAVTDCQNEVAHRRRAVLARLRHQEVELNDALRRQRALDQIGRTQEKRDDDAVRRAEMAAQPAAQDRQKQPTQPTPAPAASAPVSRAKTADPLDVQAMEGKRQAYADKQKELVRKRQERDKRLRDEGPAKTPLPAPP